MLCKHCEQKQTLAVPGKCKKCGGVTTHFAHGLCTDCAKSLDQCQWCEAPLNAIQTSLPVSNVYVTKVRETTDLGKTFKTLRPGEEIHIEMNEDQYSDKEWDVTQPLSDCFRLKVKGPFVQNPQDGQYGIRTFIFEVVGSGSGDIELHEAERGWSWYSTSTGTNTPIAGGKQFKATFQVK
jgi:predicted secreted protein